MKCLETPIEVKGWSEFEDKLRWLYSNVVSEGPIDGQLEEPIFRGQGNHHCDWKLSTTLERFAVTENRADALSLLAYYRKITASRPVLEGLTGKQWPDVPEFPLFKDRLRENPWGWLDSFLDKQPGVYEYLAYLRHHGFPSPLLDWTASPYVAAFFAFDECAPDAEHVCVYAFLRTKLHSGSGERHFFTVGPYMRTDRRHYLQQCRYSMCVGMNGDDYRFRSHEEVLVGANGTQGQLVEFRIPASEQATALRKLELMNINPYSLFASEDALVRTIVRRECYFKDWGL